MTVFRVMLLVLLVALAGGLTLRYLERERGSLPRTSGGELEVADRAPEPVAAARVSLTGDGAGDRGAADAGGGGANRELAARLIEANREAVEALDAGDVARAIPLLEECVEGAPQQPVFRRNLAEALARRAFEGHGAGDPELRERAAVDLARAVELDPDRADLAEMLERWRRSEEAESEFWHKTTEHFELSFDGTRDELMWGTAPLENELEAAYHELGELFGTFPVEEGRARFRVVLYRPEAFGSVTGLDDWAAGAFDGTVRVPVADLGRETERLKSVLRHELVHAFVHELGGSRVPGWLNEGLAQLQEPPFRNERLVLLQRAEERLRGKALFPLADLTGSLASWDDREKIELAYAQSLAFVAYLERMHGERVVIDLVAGCKDGRTPHETFEAAVGVDLDVVLEDLARGL